MEEIKAGEYVRTNRGNIDKVIIDYNGRCNNSNCNRKHISCKYDYYNEEDITKHSFNIIDLIEVGDIIQFNDEKYEVIYDKSYNKLGILIPNKDYLAIRHISLEYIFQQNTEVKILTKEQYKKYCCKLEV